MARMQDERDIAGRALRNEQPIADVIVTERAKLTFPIAGGNAVHHRARTNRLPACARFPNVSDTSFEQ